jgi:hypothetical protein
MKIIMSCIFLLGAVGDAAAQSSANLTVLGDYADMLALNEGCKTQKIDHTEKIEQFLASKIMVMELVAASPSMQKNRAEIVAVLEKTKRKDFDKTAFALLKADTLKQKPRDILEVCNEMPKSIEQDLIRDQMTKSRLEKQAK